MQPNAGCACFGLSKFCPNAFWGDNGFGEAHATLIEIGRCSQKGYGNRQQRSASAGSHRRPVQARGASLSQRELTDEDRGRLAKIKVELDQCWDLLRQRRALREFGHDPDQAKVRPPKVVENYEQ